VKRRGVAIVLAMAFLASACGTTEAPSAVDAAAQEPTASSTASGEAESGDNGEATVPAQTDAVPVNSPLTGQFSTLSGESINLDDFQGEDVVLWFWAPW